MALLGRRIPIWINRLANWGTAIGSALPEALRPEILAPKIIDAQADQFEEKRALDTISAMGSKSKRRAIRVKSKLEIMTEKETNLVVDSLLKDRGKSITDMLLFARVAEAMNWPHAAGALSRAIDDAMLDLSTHCLDSDAFEQLSFLCNLSLPTMMAANDHGSAR